MAHLVLALSGPDDTDLDVVNARKELVGFVSEIQNYFMAFKSRKRELRGHDSSCGVFGGTIGQFDFQSDLLSGIYRDGQNLLEIPLGGVTNT